MRVPNSPESHKSHLEVLNLKAELGNQETPRFCYSINNMRNNKVRNIYKCQTNGAEAYFSPQTCFYLYFHIIAPKQK